LVTIVVTEEVWQLFVDSSTITITTAAVIKANPSLLVSLFRSSDMVQGSISIVFMG
jgi:hypothetical protein